jgi:hypothetical protein
MQSLHKRVASRSARFKRTSNFVAIANWLLTARAQQKTHPTARVCAFTTSSSNCSRLHKLHGSDIGQMNLRTREDIRREH